MAKISFNGFDETKKISKFLKSISKFFRFTEKMIRCMPGEKKMVMGNGKRNLVTYTVGDENNIEMSSAQSI